MEFWTQSAFIQFCRGRDWPLEHILDGRRHPSQWDRRSAEIHLSDIEPETLISLTALDQAYRAEKSFVFFLGTNVAWQGALAVCGGERAGEASNGGFREPSFTECYEVPPINDPLAL